MFANSDDYCRPFFGKFYFLFFIFLCVSNCLALVKRTHSVFRMWESTFLYSECVLFSGTWWSSCFDFYDFMRFCSLTTECVLVLKKVFSYYRMCSRTTECDLLLQNVFWYWRRCSLSRQMVQLNCSDLSHAVMSVLQNVCIEEGVLLLQNVFSRNVVQLLRPLTRCNVCVHQGHLSSRARGVFSYYRMCSLTTECVLLL